MAATASLLSYRLGNPVEDNGEYHDAEPADRGEPMSRRPMPRSTICPSPPTAIMDATTTMESAIIRVWLTPAMMVRNRKR